MKTMTAGKRLFHIAFVSTLCFGFQSQFLDAEVSVYWTDEGLDKVQRSVDGGPVEDLVDMGISLRGIGLDDRAGKMYLAERSGNGILRANLDGTGIETVLSGGISPNGLALDLTAEKVYWTDFANDKIQRSNLDGTSVEDLVLGIDGASGIALDVVREKMYWTDFVSGKVQRANLDGSSVEDLVLTGNDNQLGIALDLVNDRMYWVDQFNAIQSANLDGTDVVQQLTVQGAFGVAIEGSKLYWSEFTAGRIRRANLDGSEIEDIVPGGLSFPTFIDTTSLPIPEPTTCTLALAALCLAMNRRLRGLTPLDESALIGHK